MTWQYLRMVNCLTQPERSLVEVFRVLVFGLLVNPCPKAVYDALWATATWGTDVRRERFEDAFALTNLHIDGFDFVITLIPEWFVAYNDVVEAGGAPIDSPCPVTTY